MLIQAPGNRPGAQARDVVRPQDLSYFTHEQPLVRHRDALPEIREGPTMSVCPASLSSGAQTLCTVTMHTDK